ncbi:MAG: PepSY-like domain-containing protein [Ginsengibacter sp.]
MKKYLMLFAIAGVINTATFAQSKEKKETVVKTEKKELKEKEEMDEKSEKSEHKMLAHIVVPATVKSAFAKEYPGTSAKWEKENGKYESNFKHDGHEMSALFNTDGSLEETEMEIKISQLPAGVTSYVRDNRKGSSIKEASKITKANGDINYEAEVKGTDLIFDSNGKFIKQQED